MLEPPPPLRLAGRQIDRPADGLSLADALAQARRLFDGFAPGALPELAALRQALRQRAGSAARDGERVFVLGWLAWLDGHAAAAEGVLADAEALVRQPPADEPPTDLPPLDPALLTARVTYWLARVRLLAGKPNALADYEAALRRLGGWPQATAWYVDLLWRGGRVDRAEGVWKSVRANKRVAAAEEAPLLDARVHLRKGELAPAERLLREASVTSGVVWVERQLLLAWALAGQRKFDAAREALADAGRGPYPAAALAWWKALVEARLKGDAVEVEQASPLWRPYLQAQADRAAGRPDDAAAGYREAAALALTQPFARYGLACLGQDDPAAVLAAAPGMFLAIRCRARQAMARFARRESAPADLLDALRQAGNAGYQARAVEHYRRLAEALQLAAPTAADLTALVETAASPEERGNALRVALELADRLAPADAAAALAGWADDPALADAELREAHGRAARRAALRAGEDVPAEPDHPAAVLGHVAEQLAAGQALDDAARDRLRSVDGRYRGVALSLLLHDAAVRDDLAAVAELLEPSDGWRGLRPAPPAFVVAALAALVSAHPTHVAWRQALARWLPLWPLGRLGADGAALAAAAGLAAPAEDVTVPTGVEPRAWWLHQASRAVLRGEPAAAVDYVHRAGEAALPALRRLADAEALTALPGAPAGPAALAGLADEVGALGEGEAVLAAARAGDGEEARRLLGERAGLSPRLHHHLALLATRAALAQERTEPAAAAEAWRRAWRHWLALLAAPEAPAGAALFDHLLTAHRARLNDLLRQGEVEPARRYAALVRQLPDMAGPDHPHLRDDLAGRAARFWDELATEHLLATRESMRFGDIPEGWRADYERGLTALRRLMALDRDNVRLLTAVVETCAAWFLDLYNTHDPDRLRQEVERYAPLAAHLVRLTASQPGDHPARPALAEFYKFRGFVEADPASRAALYREALRLNPRNDNVRDLLAQLEGEATGGDDD